MPLASHNRVHTNNLDNGHLSENYRTRAALQRKLKQLENIDPVQSPSATTPKPSAMATSYLDHRPTASGLNQRRQYTSNSPIEDGASNIDQVGAAIESGEPLDLEQVQTFERIIQWEIDALTEDLKGKCTTGGNIYPNNLTIANHCEYIVLPTLVYELEYPRSEEINWWYVLEKGVAVFGILGLMNLVSQAYIYPVVVKANEMKETMSVSERLVAFPTILNDLMFPFIAEYMMVSSPQLCTKVY